MTDGIYQGIIVYDGLKRTVACFSVYGKDKYNMFVREKSVSGMNIVCHVWLNETFESIDKNVVLEAVAKQNNNNLVSIIQQCDKYTSPA